MILWVLSGLASEWGILTWKGYVRGVYVRQSRDLTFRTPFLVTENDNVHCVLILQGGYVQGVSSGVATDRGALTQGVMSGGFGKYVQ